MAILVVVERFLKIFTGEAFKFTTIITTTIFKVQSTDFENKPVNRKY